jgi:hypothetical protein
MARIPPAAEREELLETAQECYCCRCMRCDYAIGTITVTFTGTFSMEREYESPTDPGYYDRETYSGNWTLAKTFNQEIYDGTPGLGKFQWSNNATYSATSGECTCDDIMIFGDDDGVDYWLDGVTDPFDYLVVAVEDPNTIITDSPGSTFATDSFVIEMGSGTLPKEIGWAGRYSSGLFHQFFLQQSGTATTVLTGVTSLCQHPRGTYTETFDDSLNVTYNANEFVNWQHAFSITVEIGGDGAMRNCEAAPINFF